MLNSNGANLTFIAKYAIFILSIITLFLLVKRLFLILLSSFLVACSGYELHRRYQDAHFLVLETRPLNQADTLIVQQRWQEARYLARLVQAQPELGDRQRAQSIAMAAETAQASLLVQSEAFIQGALSGEANNRASLMGALLLDLFLIGDIRDLLVQGYKEIVYDEGDEVVIALSATGLSLTLLPGVHWAPAILKSFKRTGALSERFISILHKHAHTALETGDFQPLARVVTDFSRSVRAMGPVPASGVMHTVHTENDLAKLANAASLDPGRSYSLVALSGRRGLKQLNKDGRNIATVSRKLKLGSRLGKSAKKSLGSLPVSYVVTLFLLSLSLLAVTLFRKRRR